MKTKNNTFKRIAAGALATISVASYALPANVFGGTTIVNSLGAALVSHAADEEAVVKNDIDFNDARTFINSIAIGDNNIGGNTLAFIDSGKVNAKKGETITIKSKTTLDIDKLIPNSISTNEKYNTAAINGKAIEVTKDDKKDYYIESEKKAEEPSPVESEPAVPANAKESYTAAANYMIGDSDTGKLTDKIETEYEAENGKYGVYPVGVKAAKADINNETPFSFYKEVETGGDVVLNPTAIANEEGTMTLADVAAEGVDVEIPIDNYKSGQYVQKVSPYVDIEFVGDTPTKLTLKEGAVAYKDGDSKVYTAKEDITFIATVEHPDGVLNLDAGYKFYKDVTVANNNEGKPALYEAATENTLAANKVNIIDVAKADLNGNYKLETGLTLAAGVDGDQATKAFVAKEGYKFIKELTPATANTPAVYEVKDEIDAADVTYQYYEKVDPQFEVVNTPAPLTAKEDNYSKAYADGEYTYTFKMPEYAVKLNKLAFEIEPGDTEATIAPETAYDNETNKYTAVPGVDMTITSKDKNQLDLTTYVYATDSNGKKIQCTDDKGNLIYKNGEFYYSLVDTKEGGVANNLYNAVKADEDGELETLTFTAKAIEDENKLNIGEAEAVPNYKIPKADITKYLTPVYKIEKVKIAATRTPKLNSSAEITNYKYTFKMPDLEEGVNDTVYGEDTLNKVFVAVHQHVHDADAWVYSVSTDGTELYRQCTIDDDDACPEKNQKLLVAMIRNKVTDDEGKVTYNKINKYTYGKAITPVLLTMVFNEDGSPVLNEDKSFKYDEKVLDETQTYVVVNYEDTNVTLGSIVLDDNDPEDPDDDTYARFGTANVGNYVVKFTPNKATVGGYENASLYAADVDAREKSELSFYFDVVQKQLTIDNVVTKHGTVYDEKKQVFNVTPISVVEDMDFDIKDGANVLVAGRDYIIIGSTTSSVAGEHTFTVKGIGNYTGTFEVKWDLMGTAATQELTADMVEIETIPHGTYAERVVHVYGLDQFGRIDKNSENATYAITGTQYATEKGTYDITITGTGNYYGTLNLKWYVNRADITGKVSVVDGASFDASDNKLAISSVGSLKPYNPGNGNTVPVSQQTLTKVGLIATKDFSLTENMDVNSNNSAIFVRGKDGADVESKTSYVLTWKKSNATANDVWYVKPFTQFKIGTKTITVYGDLTRVQGDTAEVIKNGSAQVRMTKSTVKLDANNTGKYVLATNSYLAVPDGCTMLKAGVIASTTREKVVNKSVLNNEAQSTDDGLYVRFKEGNDVAPYQRYSFTWKKTNTARDEVYFVKPFVQYKDADGVIHTVYGTIKNMSPESLNLV